MSGVGILIVPDGSDINDGVPIYDSRNRHMLVDLEANPKHLDVVDIVPGTALALAGGLNEYHEEVLISIDHNLSFRPTVWVYFTDLGGTGYGQDFYFFSGSAGTFADALAHRESEDKVEIFHYVQDYANNTIWTSPAPNYKFRIKYFVFSNPNDRIL